MPELHFYGFKDETAVVRDAIIERLRSTFSSEAKPGLLDEIVFVGHRDTHVIDIEGIKHPFIEIKSTSVSEIARIREALERMPHHPDLVSGAQLLNFTPAK